MRRQVLAVVFLVAMSACDQTTNPGTSPQPVDFSNLQVGQESRYLFFTGNELSPDISYSGDMLTLTVVAKTSGDRFTLRESLPSERASVILKDVPVTSDFTLAFKDGTVRMWGIPESARPGFFYPWVNGNTGPLPLAPVIEPEMKIQGLRPVQHCGNACFGFVENHLQLGHRYQRLNVLLDDTAMSLDGPGMTALFSAQDGIVRVSTYSAWTGEGYGWDLAPRGYRDMRNRN